MIGAITKVSFRYSRQASRNVRHNVNVNIYKNNSNLYVVSNGTKLIQTRHMSIFNFFSPPKTPPPPPSDDTPKTLDTETSGMVDSLSDPVATEAAMEAISDTAVDVITEVTAAVIPAGSWNPKYQIMHLIVGTTQFLDIPYWQAIVVVTLGVRFLMLPLAIKTVVGSSRLAFVRPKIQKLQEAMNKDPMGQSLEAKQKLQADMMAIFKKHKVNPFMTVLWPFFQLPVFMAFFFALQEIGTYFPAYATGGGYWFVNLSAADPTMILPVMNCAGFLMLAQLGGEGMDQFQKPRIKWAMRGIGIIMIPLTMHMPAGLFVHWVTQGFVAASQAILFRIPAVKKALGIMDPPPSTAVDSVQDPFANALKVKFELSCTILYFYCT